MITKVFCVFEFVFFPLLNANEISFFLRKMDLIYLPRCSGQTALVIALSKALLKTM